MKNKSFGIIGAAGFVAPRHMKAIRDTNNVLRVICDVNDSVGIIDSYFPEAEFFNNSVDFFAFAEQVKLNYIVVCTPSYLHFQHVKKALECGINVICEKPLGLDVNELRRLQKIRDDNHLNVYTILQLRHHPSLWGIKSSIQSNTSCRNVRIRYISSRGNWYKKSWKGDQYKSGGLLMNLGVHLFDMLIWLFGNPKRFELFEYNDSYASGTLSLQKANVNWELSYNWEMLPRKAKENKQSTYRSIVIDDKLIDFNSGFDGLHTICYEHILDDDGIAIEDTLPAIQLVNQMNRE